MTTPGSNPESLTQDVMELFDEIAGSLRHEHRAYSGECRPPIDVLETDEAIEVSVDVSGVPAEGLRVLFRAGVLMIVGEKAPGPTPTEHTFHLVEREFGRFARAVHLMGAIDVARAHATLRHGELAIVLPKIVERRGQGHRIPITTSGRGPA